MGFDFFYPLLKACDAYIRQYGGEEGYYKFRKDHYKTLTPEQLSTDCINSIDAGDAASPFYARILLSMYADGEKMGKTPLRLKEWVLERLLKVGDGESADSAFHLKSRAGIRRTKPMHNHLKYICFITLKIREGMTKPQAIEACVQEFKADHRHLYRLMKGVHIGDEISNKTLIFFRDKDISDHYSAF